MSQSAIPKHARSGTAGTKPRRSLILAGGGLKVAFQAGVLQVWLDEAGVAFDHADGASGGLLNLALWAQGMSGRQIADAWRRYEPLKTIGINWSEVWKLYWARSFFTFDRLREVIKNDWGLNLDLVRASKREASFNLYNFSQHRLEVTAPANLTEDHVLSGIALPTWFPPVQINGDYYIDAVYATDGNIEEAIDRGADEIWIIWTVSTKGRWCNGWIRHYFQIIEAAANSRYHRVIERINRNNRAFEGGGVGEYGRPIGLKVMEAEVPLHYLFNFSAARFAAAVELGVAAARQWCGENEVALTNDA